MGQIAEVECGDYHDNRSLFDLAVLARDQGKVELAQEKLERLQRHIIETGENSSAKFLLFDIEELLKEIEERL